MTTAIKALLIIGCVTQGASVLPLAWCLPITITILNRMKRKESISMWLKICSLLFVNVIAGICLLCVDAKRAKQKQ